MKSKTIFVVYEADWDYHKNLAAFPTRGMAEDWMGQQSSTDEDGFRRSFAINEVMYFE
jgi:hypothetical protein